MNDVMNEIEAFHLKIHISTKDEYIKYIDSCIIEKNQLVQNGINAASIVQSYQNESLLKAYNDSDLINVDGISVFWALRLFKYKVPERVACPDLAHEILTLATYKNYKLFLFGANQANLIAAEKNIHQVFPNLTIAGVRNGYYRENEEMEIIKKINDSKADILFIAMPSPKKEFFVEKYRSILATSYILGVGGYFDILAGVIKRAPVWMQKAGLEWFFRFLQEPRRMWKRYLFGNIQFIYIVFKEKMKRALKVSS